MELRAYWTIIWRRIWIVVLVVGIVALYVGYQYYHLRKLAPTLTTYTSNVTVQLGIQTIGATPNIAATTSTAEAFADALATGPILTSPEFDTQVSNQIQADMGDLAQQFGPNPGLGDWKAASTIGSALTATRTHSFVAISVSWSISAGAYAVARATGEVITADAGQYFDYMLKSSNSAVTSTNPAVKMETIARVTSGATQPAAVPGSTSNKQLTLLLLLLVALVIGIALAFLLEYLDDRIRSKDEVATLLQLPVYGEVPRAPTIGRTRTQREPEAPAA